MRFKSRASKIQNHLYSPYSIFFQCPASCYGCHEQSTLWDWSQIRLASTKFAYCRFRGGGLIEKQKFILTVLVARKSKLKGLAVSMSGEDPLPVHRQLSSGFVVTRRKEEGAVKSTNPIRKSPPSGPNYSKRFHLQMPSYQGLSFKIRSCRQTHNSVHSRVFRIRDNSAEGHLHPISQYNWLRLNKDRRQRTVSQEPIELFPQCHSAVGKQVLYEKLSLCSLASSLLTSV